MYDPHPYFLKVFIAEVLPCHHTGMSKNAQSGLMLLRIRPLVDIIVEH